MNEEQLQEELLVLLHKIFSTTPIECLENEVFAYGIRNYMAKYSLQNERYGVSEAALTLLNNEGLYTQQPILKGAKKKYPFKYEHVIPMKVLFSYIKALKHNNQYSEELFRDMMERANKVFIITTEENIRLDRKYEGRMALQNRMPQEYEAIATFWDNDADLFSRYSSRNIIISNELISMRGAVVR